MNCVDWPTAAAFCEWDTAGGALPTEAQWEYAERGPAGRPWPWGGPEGSMFDGRVCRDHQSGTCLEADPAYERGATPSPERVWHLAGNVWEWTRDWYAPYSDPTCWNMQVRTNPLCVNDASGHRSFRGGSWNGSEASFVRSGARSGAPPADVIVDVGFRCARPLLAPS